MPCGLWRVSIGFRGLNSPGLRCVRTRQAQLRQRSCPAVPNQTTVFEDLLEFGYRQADLAQLRSVESPTWSWESLMQGQDCCGRRSRTARGGRPE
jgi:hypothetical protein